MDMPDSALFYYKRGYQFGSSDAKKNLERLNKKIIYDIESALESKQWNKAEQLSRGLVDSFGDHQLGRFYLVISLFEQSRFVESLNDFENFGDTSTLLNPEIVNLIVESYKNQID